MWAFLAIALLIAILEVAPKILLHRRRPHRTDVGMSHDEYDKRISRWDTLSTMQQLRDQHAQDQLTYGMPLHERPLDLEVETTNK